MSDNGFSLFQPKGSTDTNKSVLTPPSASEPSAAQAAPPVVPPSAPPLFPPANAAPPIVTHRPPVIAPALPAAPPAPAQAALSSPLPAQSAPPPSTPPIAAGHSTMSAPHASVSAPMAPSAPVAPHVSAPASVAPAAAPSPERATVAAPAPTAERAPEHAQGAEPALEHVQRGGRRRTAETEADGDLLWALHQVVAQGASDLHLAVDAAPRIRLHGSLRDLPTAVPWTVDKMRSALHSIMSPTQRETFDDELELDFAFTLTEDSRFRVNVYQQRGKMGAAFRLIPTEIKPLSALGVPDVVARFATLPRGLVLVTGPTGSGKSTTLAALIDLVNRTRADHIVTVEDPIEFMHPRKKAVINQREVGHDTHSFSKALKHVLRQDPDVILVGEMRDLETISVALTAAETGHLVFATLHTQSAAQTIDRIIDVYPPYQQSQVRAQLAATLQGVVCQTLVPRAGGRGRVAASEVLVATSAISNLIREGQTHQIASALQSGASQGMRTLDQHLAELVNRGLIREDAARDKAQNVDDFRGMLVTSGAPKLDAGVDFGDTFSKGQRA